MEKIFNERDLKYIAEKGLSIDKIEKQLSFFSNGIPKINLYKSAIINDGIINYSNFEIEDFCDYFDMQKDNYQIMKFVPASGAASRMFKFLTEFLNEFDFEKGSINSYLNHKKKNELKVFLVGISKFPFYEEIKKRIIDLNPDLDKLTKDQKDHLFIKMMLTDEKFNFANKPKGVLPFHFKKNKIVTPIEEHIDESNFYQLFHQKPKIHFTVSKEHQNDFKIITDRYENVNISYSYQHEHTDTIAVDLNNIPFRVSDGSLFFRPGGHGALIENLNQLDSDIIFIKNIDNVSHNHYNEIIKYKKLLGGILIKRQEEVFSFLNLLEKDTISENEIATIKEFAAEKLNITLPINFDKFQLEYKREFLFNELNRPIRVCGMVKNEGEPGGGPFWVKNDKGLISLQIVETSQINLKDKEQKKIVDQATHFNPVDLVCGIKNYKKEKFDLNDFVDHNTGFIVEKNRNGVPVKSYELPGLWNGAMANWITIFVEVPLYTFNPVKTVNDLLKPSHQPEDKEMF
jgi:hypothetical protein